MDGREEFQFFGGGAELDFGFERAADLAGFLGFFDRLGNAAADLQEGVHRRDGVSVLPGGIGLRKILRVNRAAALEVAPGLFGGVGKDRREQADEGVEHAVHGELRGAAAGGIFWVAVEPVFRDVHIQAAEIDGAELVDRVVHAVELELFVGVEAGGDDFLQTREDPAVDEGERFGRGRICGVVVVEVREEDAERIANAAVGIREAREDFLGEWNIVGEIHATDPQAEQVGTVFVHIVVGVGGFLVTASGGLRDFFARVDIHHEPMREHGAVGGFFVEGDGGHERTLEPAAVLVSRFEIEVGGEGEFGALAQDGFVAEAGIDPDIERVVAARGASGEADERGPGGIVEFEPGVRSFFRKDLGDFGDDRGVEDRFAAFGVENRERDAPSALARDAPVGAGFDCATNAVAAPVGNPICGVDLAQGGLAEVVDSDEKLLHRAEEDRRFRAPAVRVVVQIIGVAEQRVAFGEDAEDFLVALLEDMQADEFGDAAFRGEFPKVVDGREDIESIGLSCEVVVRAMAGGDVDLARAFFHGDEIGGDDGNFAIEEGMSGFGAGEFGAGKLASAGSSGGLSFREEGLPERVGDDERLGRTIGESDRAQGVFFLRVDGNGEVRGERPGRGRPDDKRGVADWAAGGGEGDMDGGICALGVFHLGLGESGVRAGAPEDGFFLAIDEAFFDELREGADHPGLVGGIESEVGIFPIAEHAEAFELAALDVDEFAGVFLRTAADLSGCEAGGSFDHAELDREAVAVPAWNERRAKAGHGFGFHHEILEDFVQRGAHVDIAVGEGRAVVEEVERGILPALLDFLVEAARLPLGEDFGFALGEAGLHREGGFRKVDGVFVAAHEKGERNTSAAGGGQFLQRP